MSSMSIINELTVASVDNSIRFYQNNFGFTVELTEGEPATWAQLKKDDTILMLEDYGQAKNEVDNYPAKTSSSNLLRFEYDDAEEIKTLYGSLNSNNVNFFMDYTETDYGKVEFGIYDPDRNMIIVSFLAQ